MQDIKDRVAEAKQAALEVTAGVLELRQTIKELTEREAKLVEALKFYADKENTCYDVDGRYEYWHDGMEDFCCKAKSTLKELDVYGS